MARLLNVVLSSLLLGTTYAQSQGSQGSGNGDSSLPQAKYSRTSAASVVTSDKWLLIGGTARTWTSSAPSDAALDEAQQALVSSITVFDLSDKSVQDVAVGPGRDGVNRLNSTAQTCEFDSNGNKIYCFGGRTISPAGAERTLLSGIGVFNPATFEWEDTRQTNIPERWGHTSVVLGDTMYIYGGRDNNNNLLNDLWAVKFPYLNTQQIQTSSGPSPRAWQCTTRLNDTAFLVVGGTGNNGPLAEAWVFSKDDQTWTDISKKLSGVPLDRTGRVCGLVSGTVVLYGGLNKQNQLQSDIWNIDNTTFQVSQSSATSSRRLHRRQQFAGTPTTRVFAQSAALSPYFAVFGGQTGVDPNLQEWVANDKTFYFRDTKASSWVPSSDRLSFLSATASGSVVGQDTGATNAVMADTNGCGRYCVSQGALAGLLAGGIALLAAMGLLAAFSLAMKEGRRIMRHHRYQDLEAGKPARQTESIQRSQNMDEANRDITPPSTAMTTHPAPVPLSAPNTPSPTPIATAVPSTFTSSAPQTPHRSDSRRRVHSPLAAAIPSALPQGKVYKVLWQATPSQPDEIDADVGDVVEERRLFADGWAMVRNLTKGGTGMIPVNILQELKEGDEGYPSGLRL
ncbi:hypothetical protein SpCBS45565_g01459 [Spizellomyces sp. 'palustris']|nr:hypothetical protein SpCBS45565_g01459 [Spizellomyces sp. 'palustris']